MTPKDESRTKVETKTEEDDRTKACSMEILDKIKARQVAAEAKTKVETKAEDIDETKARRVEVKGEAEDRRTVTEG